MVVVFDLDNVLTDEFGSAPRPGVTVLLERLNNDGDKLVLWTNSKRDRARDIIGLHKFNRYFQAYVFREDYDPEEKGLHKDIRRVGGSFLVDDDPAEIRYVRSIGRKGFLASSYRKGSKSDMNELREMYREICKARRPFARTW